MPNQDTATTQKTPQAGTPGGKMVGYAEAERIANPDKGPSAESDNLAVVTKELESVTGKTIGEMTEADFYNVPIKLIAQSQMYSTELTVQMKDPSMACRWFNKDHKGGAMVQQAIYRGYQPCTKDDVEYSHATATDERGAITMGDLVLLKMSKIRHFSMYKDNAEKAKYRVSQQLSKPFGAHVPGTDNGSLNNTPVSPYMIESKTGSSFVDASQARELVFNK
jgi:hypothetical protein